MKSRRHEWTDTDIIEIEHVCLILHNMLVALRIEGALEDEKDENGNLLHRDSAVAKFEASRHIVIPIYVKIKHRDDDTQTSWMDISLGIYNSIRKFHDYNKLCGALTGHMWNAPGVKNSSINQ